MSVELNALSPIDPADVSDDDLLLVWDSAAPSGNAKKATRGQVLAGVVRDGADATLGIVTADDVAAPAGSIDELTVTTGLIMGDTINLILKQLQTIALADIAAAASASPTITVTGAVVGDFVIVNAPSTIPAGFIVRGYVSGADTVTLRLYNASSSTLVGASHDFSVLVVRAT